MERVCYDLAKQLSYYLYLLFFPFLLDLLHKEKYRKVLCHPVSYSHIVTVSYHMMSHDRSHDKCGKVVHRLYSSCISSV